ncbi:MAG: aldolase/citrate lyase family protein [Candidatus Bathyarchaeota archaeon]|nr:aldolase/citrate lyase family protein [Candidatus Bathyarchaeota archaeon]
MRNLVKEKLGKGEVAVGAWMSILDPTVARVVAASGLDWVLFDTEHGPPSFETVDGLVRAVGRDGALPLVRVVWNDINAIKRALDTGAFGVIVPWVNTKEEAEDAVTYCRYAPEGLRGCAPGRAARAWGISSREYLKMANDEILVAVQIETKKAIENIEGIVSVEGVDATFIGPSDLSASMGLRGEFFHPEVVKAMERVVEACQASGVAPGIAFGMGIDHVNSLIDSGFRFVGVGSDTGFLAAGCRQTLEKIRR